MTNTLIKKLEKAINRALHLDPESLDRLAELSGQVLSLEFINTGLVLFILPVPEGIQLEIMQPGDVAVRIRGTPVNMLAYLAAASGSGEGITGKLEIIGDVGLAQRFQSIIKDVDLDWEEQLSHWLGDTLAHKIGNLVRYSARFARNTRHTLALDISEYLRYEKEILPEQPEVDEYNSAIDALRNDAERLKLRINKLVKTTQELP